EGMRVARTEKEKQLDLRAEAAEILAQGAAEAAPVGKLSLYRHLRAAGGKK
ncbi:unnamed protein product, partial [marine sediment metagenome]